MNKLFEPALRTLTTDIAYPAAPDDRRGRPPKVVAKRRRDVRWIRVSGLFGVQQIQVETLRRVRPNPLDSLFDGPGRGPEVLP